jgi:GMP synthase (glutamine-hydrolysing)
MKPFLYLDNWHERQAKTRFDRFLDDSGLPIEVQFTNEGQFPDHHDYSGVFITPSFDGAYDDLPWVHELHSVLRRFGEAQVPMLGLCFGSQILASALVGREQVFIRDAREKGFGTIALTEAAETDPIMKGLPDTMPVFHWHGDEVRGDHEAIVVLADSDDCGNQIWRWSQGPVWGIQPHPEMDSEGLVRWFAENRQQFEAGGMDYERLRKEAHDSQDAFGALCNFVDYVKQNAH